MTAFNTITRNIADARVYTNTARVDNAQRALTEDELYRVAPSVFAVEAHESRSERFKPIPTIEILRGLNKEGFQVVGATQARTRDASKREFTKHLLRLRRIDAILRATLRAGAYELEHRKDVPARVVVSEYVDVAHAFVDRDETGMVNAVLDQIARQFRGGEFAR